MWYRGKIEPIWAKEYKNLNYIHKPANSRDLEHWRRQGFNFDTYTGEMFAEQHNMPTWVHNVAEQIGLIDCGFTFYKMKSGIVMPKHVDHFEKYCNIFNCTKKEVWRAIVALEDWQSGHYFEINNTPIIDYTAGEYVVWSHEEQHMAANIGENKRYTLQITGKKL